MIDDRPLSEIYRDIEGAEAMADHYDDLYDERGYRTNKNLANEYRAELKRALNNGQSI